MFTYQIICNLLPMIMMLRFLSLSSGPLPDPPKKSNIPSHMSGMTALCQLGCVSEGLMKILPKTNKEKTPKQWSVHSWCGLHGPNEQSRLQWSTGLVKVKGDNI